MTVEINANSVEAYAESLKEMIDDIKTIKKNLVKNLNNRKKPAGLSDIKEPLFSPEVHIVEGIPSHSWTFEDLGISTPATAASDIAATSPFPLYTAEAIPHIRKALLNPTYINQTGCLFGQNLVIRNTGAYSPFFRRLCSHPAVMRTLSRAAGVELEPVMETMELGHGNVQVDLAKYQDLDLTQEEKLKALATELTSERLSRQNSNILEVQARSMEQIQEEVDSALVPWHYDSYPWVCVVMLSDTSGMIGGETVIRCGDDSIQGISQPRMGSAMMLQGGLVRHLALPSSSPSGDRITLVTSFRPKDVAICDSSFMSNIRCYSDLPMLYLQWIQYRLDRLEPGIKRLEDKKLSRVAQDENDPTFALLVILKEYAKRTLRHMVAADIVHALNDRHGKHLCYTVRDDYVSGALFKVSQQPCPRCSIANAKVDKAHLAVCPGSIKWQPNNPVWADCSETHKAIKNWGLEMEIRILELQVNDVVHKWLEEYRDWGIADELAVQGLNEYLVDFLEFYGMRF